MLDVFSVFWGDKYNKAYVYALKEMVAKNLTLPHRFRCITNQHLPGINTVLPPVSYPGWWQKIGLFAPLLATGPSVYFDLDVVITGNVDYLADYTDRFSAPANWAQSGYGGIQSSVMCWPGNWTAPYERFDWQDMQKRKVWGDQEYLWELLGDDWQRIPHVGSYKYHCKQSVPSDMRVMVFHGKPDPDEVTDPWILPYTSTLRSLIRENTRNGLSKAS